MVPVLVPPDPAKTTVSPPAVNGLLFASLVKRVRVTLDPEATDEREAVSTDWETDAAPGLTVTVGRVLVTALPPIVELIVVAVPATTPVKVAV